MSRDDAALGLRAPRSRIAVPHALNRRRYSLAALAGVTAFDRSPHTGDPLMGAGRLARARDETRRDHLSDVRYRMSCRSARRDTARGPIAHSFTPKRAADVMLDFRGPWLGGVRVNGGEATTEFNGAHLRIPARSIHAGENVVEMSVRGTDRAGRREHHPLPRRPRQHRLPLHAARSVGRERALSLLRPAGPQGAPHAFADRARPTGTRWPTASPSRSTRRGARG